MLARRLLASGFSTPGNQNAWIPTETQPYLLSTGTVNISVSSAGVSGAPDEPPPCDGYTATRTVYSVAPANSAGGWFAVGADIYQGGGIGGTANGANPDNGGIIPTIVATSPNVIGNGGVVAFNYEYYPNDTPVTAYLHLLGGATILPTVTGAASVEYNTDDDSLKTFLQTRIAFSPSTTSFTGTAMGSFKANFDIYKYYEAQTGFAIAVQLAGGNEYYLYDGGPGTLYTSSQLPVKSTIVTNANGTLDANYAYEAPLTNPDSYSFPTTTETVQTGWAQGGANAFGTGFGEVFVPGSATLSESFSGYSSTAAAGGFTFIYSGNAAYFYRGGVAGSCMAAYIPGTFLQSPYNTPSSTVASGHTYTANPGAIQADGIPLIYSFDGSACGAVPYSASFEMAVDENTLSRSVYFHGGMGYARAGGIYVPSTLTILEEAVVPNASFFPSGFPYDTTGLVGYKKISRQSVGIMRLFEETAVFYPYSTVVTTVSNVLQMSGDTAASATFSYYNSSSWASQYPLLINTQTNTVYPNEYANLPANANLSFMPSTYLPLGFLPLEDGDYFVSIWPCVATDPNTGDKTYYVVVFTSNLGSAEFYEAPAPVNNGSIGTFMHAGAIALTDASGGNWLSFDKGQTWASVPAPTGAGAANVAAAANNCTTPFFAI